MQNKRTGGLVCKLQAEVVLCQLCFANVPCWQDLLQLMVGLTCPMTRPAALEHLLTFLTFPCSENSSLGQRNPARFIKAVCVSAAYQMDLVHELFQGTQILGAQGPHAGSSIGICRTCGQGCTPLVQCFCELLQEVTLQGCNRSLSSRKTVSPAAFHGSSSMLQMPISASRLLVVHILHELRGLRNR